MSKLSHKPLHELYLTCHGELEAVLFSRVNCRETAADLCQEAFARLCRIDDLGSIGNLKAYLFRTAQNLLYDHYRSQAASKIQHLGQQTDIQQEVEDFRCAETVVMGEEQINALIDALAGLPPQCQRIFYLNRFEGLKHRDIADHLQISIRTVEENIKRALLHCTNSLNKP
jgi:RNA polymerase sigma-70 factor (ECF subfamily)